MRHATLCFPIRDGEVLLIRKKRGLGAGKVVGPGGKVEDGETATEAAVRETHEEVGLRVEEIEKVGEFAFTLGDVSEHGSDGISERLRRSDDSSETGVSETREPSSGSRDDSGMFVHVFRTEAFSGSPRESAEAVPEWFDVDDVPYGEMWDGDQHWLPLVFEGETFAGEFAFDAEGEVLRDYELDVGVALG